MKKLFLGLTASFGTLSLLAVTPKVANVSYEQNPNTRVVTVTYDIDQDAIITLDVLTNGVSIGQEHVRNVTGNANRVVKKGTGLALQWNPLKEWSGQNITDNIVQMRVEAWDVTQPPDYMVVDLAISNTVNYYVCEAALPGGIGDARYRRDKLVMRRIPAAGETARMGSPVGEPAKEYDSGRTYPVERELLREVQFTNDYYMAVFELTRGQYYKITGTYKDGTWNTDTDFLPAITGLTWTELRGKDCLWPEQGHAVATGTLIGKLRGFSGLTTFDLPTEARWEYACRAGVMTGLYNGLEWGGENANSIAWNWTMSLSGPQGVGQLQPNGWGLYDMLGNIFERCLDRMRVNFPTPAVVEVDPAGPRVGEDGVTDKNGVLRGGSWFEGSCRSAVRGFYSWDSDDSTHRWGVRLSCQAW